MILMQLEMPLEMVYSTYELAAKNNIPVILDAGPAMNIPLDRLKGIFVISPNEAETKSLTGIDPDSEENAIAAAKRLYEMATPQYVVLKLGVRGALVFDGINASIIPCFDNVQAIDSTAAGDTFSAALAVRLCKGDSIHDAVVYAHGAAGICVTRRGGQPAIPFAHEVEVFLKENEKCVN